MKNYTEVQVINNVVSSTVCNCCGKEIKSLDNMDNDNYEETINITHYFGYFSKIFYDGEVHNLDVCETCYAEWIKSFKIAPEEY